MGDNNSCALGNDDTTSIPMTHVEVNLPKQLYVIFIFIEIIITYYVFLMFLIIMVISISKILYLRMSIKYLYV